MRARHLILFLVFALFVPALGVGHADPVQDAAGVCDPIDGSACMLPWPNNFFTRPDPSSATGLRLNVNAVATPRNAAGMPVDPTDWNRLDGFSPGSPVLTHVPGMDTPTAFANTNPPTNIDIARSFDEDSPIVVLDAATGRRWPIWTELDRSVDLNGVPPTADRTALIIHPAQNFAEGHRYIVALRDMKNSDGATLAPQSAFADFIDDKGPAARQTYFDEQIFPQLADVDIARGSLYLAWDFTVASTQSLTDTILFMRDDALAQLGDTSPGDGIVQGSAPKYVIDSVTQQVPCGVNIGVPPVECSTSGPPPLDSRVYAHIQGRVFVPCYLDVPGCPPGARFTYLTPNDVLPTPVPGNTMAANFQCNIPIGAKDGEQFRPAVYGHGLFGTADEVNSGKLY